MLKTITSDHELVIPYYGNDISEEDVNELQAFIESRHDVAVEIVNGAQPNYHLISFE